MAARRSLPVALAAVCAALLACSAAAPAGGPAGEIAFLSTLPSWPPPENLDAARLYSAGTAGKARQRLEATAGATDGDLMSSLSPDRSRIAVVRESGLWIVNADGSGERLLLKPLRVESPVNPYAIEWFYTEDFTPPAWSPDGSRLAVSVVDSSMCGPASTKCATWAIVVVDMEGRRIERFDEMRNGSWAPDGEWLAVESGSDGGFSMTPEVSTIDVVHLGDSMFGPSPSSGVKRRHGEYRQFARPSWSPDGRTIVFADDDLNGVTPSRMHVVRASDAKLLFSAPGTFAGWSRDASKIVFVGSGARPVYVVGRDGRGLRRLAVRSGGVAAFSRDGKRVVYVGRPKDGRPLYSVGVDGRGLRRLVATTGGSFAVAPGSPLIAYSQAGGRDLAVVASTGGKSRRVSRQPEPWRVHPIGWSADGAHVLFSGISTTLPNLALWVMRVDGTEGRVLARGVSDPEQNPGPPMTFWSPDGKWLAYRTSTGLNVIGRDGRGAHAVAPAPVNGFSWAPDSTRLAYADDKAVNVVQRDGKSRRKLASAAAGPAWSPAGDWIAYATTSGTRIVHPDGTGGRILVPRTADTVPGSPAWSPDGKQVAYTWAGRIDVVVLDTGSVRTVHPRTALGGCWTPLWSPDGTTLAALCPGLWAIRADGNGSRLLVQAAPGDSVSLFSWSPDSRFIAYSGVFAVSVDGGGQVRLTTFNARSIAPSWAPG